MRRILAIFGLVLSEPALWGDELVKYIPGQIGSFLRRRYWSVRLHACGDNVCISTGVTFKGPSSIELGRDVNLMMNNHIASYSGGCIKIGNRVSTNRNAMIFVMRGRITIGDNVLIGPNTVIVADDHMYDMVDIPIRDQGTSVGEIVIEDDVWIGANVVILPNVTVGRGSIIAAGAVVTKSFAPYSIVGGVPAEIVGSRHAPQRSVNPTD